jgi:cobalt-zinc-cadmium efflux system membrane fusion protein
MAVLGLLVAALAAAAPDDVGAQVTQKTGDSVRVVPDQLHQVNIVAAELYPFRRQKAAIGQIAYNEDATTPILTPFPGRVRRLIAKVGETVERGDPLLELDSQDVVQPQNDFIAAAGAMNKARSQLELARIVEKRHKDLYAGSAVALKEYQQAEAGLINAENDMRAAESALDAARQRLRIVGRTDEEIAALQSRGAISRIATIRAPIAGTVIARKVGPGQYVRTDPPEALYLIADLSTMWLKAHVPETDIPLMRIGQSLDVKVNALPKREFTARIVAIGAASDTSTHRVVVRSESANRDSALKAEMFATFRITTGEPEVSPAVPIDAVIREGSIAALWVERQPMVFERRLVKIGVEQDGRMQITEGIKAGERVVGRGAIFVDNEWRQ